MRRRAAAAIAAIVLATVVAAPVGAARPDRWTEVAPDIWQQAECDGFEVWEFNVVTLDFAVFFDKDGNESRVVTRADTTGVTVRVYPGDSSEYVATYRDQGGTFTSKGDDFVWTGVIDLYVTRDGDRYTNTGRQVLHVTSWDPFEAEWTSDVGISDEWDPCTW